MTMKIAYTLKFSRDILEQYPMWSAWPDERCVDSSTTTFNMDFYEYVDVFEYFLSIMTQRMSEFSSHVTRFDLVTVILPAVDA